MTIETTCPICGLSLDVPETADEYGNPLWDATGTINAHIAAEHPSYVPAPSGLLNP